MSQWIVETMIATTLLMIAVLLLRGPVARIAGARAAYLLWAAPALRMVLPPLPEHWFGIAPALPQTTSFVSPDFVSDATVIAAGASSPAPAIAEAAGGGAAWLGFALFAWLGGAVLFFGWHWLAYRRFASAIHADAEPIGEGNRIPVAASAAISSPVALGIFGRRVFVPADFLHRFDAAEQRLALAHEYAHHKRGDLAVNLGALAMLALHWFNPVAHIAHRAFRLDQEAACDALVLANASPDERHAYGTALYKSATGPVPLAVCAMATKGQLKARLKRIVAGAWRNERVASGLAFGSLAVLGGLALTASTISLAQPDVPDVPEVPAIPDVPDVPDMPAMIALNGVEIDRDWPQTSRKVEKAREQARKAAVKARVAAEHARAVARAHRAEAAVIAREATVEARAEAAEARREALEAAAEARAEAAEAAREARVAIAAARPLAAIRPRCAGTNSASHVSVERQGAHTMKIVMCGKPLFDRAKMQTEMIAGLKSARDDLARDKNVGDSVRERIIHSLDRQIEWMSRSLAMPIPTPPAPPSAPAAPAAPAPVPAPVTL